MIDRAITELNDEQVMSKLCLWERTDVI